MIITLKNADFSKNNVGTLTTWGITKILSGVSTTDTTTRVVKDGSYTASFTVNSGYIYSSASVTMGGTDITNTALSWDSGHSVATLNISKVTGNVYIKISAVSENTEEPEINIGDEVGTYYIEFGDVAGTKEEDYTENVFVFINEAADAALAETEELWDDDTPRLSVKLEYNGEASYSEDALLEEGGSQANFLFQKFTQLSEVLPGNHVVVRTHGDKTSTNLLGAFPVKVGDILYIDTSDKVNIISK